MCPRSFPSHPIYFPLTFPLFYPLIFLSLAQFSVWVLGCSGLGVVALCTRCSPSLMLSTGMGCSLVERYSAVLRTRDDKTSLCCYFFSFLLPPFLQMPPLLSAIHFPPLLLPLLLFLLPSRYAPFSFITFVLVQSWLFSCWSPSLGI